MKYEWKMNDEILRPNKKISLINKSLFLNEK